MRFVPVYLTAITFLFCLIYAAASQFKTEPIDVPMECISAGKIALCTEKDQ